MSCGKKPLVKNWDKPRKIKVITPSRYEQNEASVKIHWKKVVRDMELSYKDDQFWESQCETVRELMGPKIFLRLAKIFNLPLKATAYEPQEDVTSLVPSEKFYISKHTIDAEVGSQARSAYSNMSDFVMPEEDQEDESLQEEQSQLWSVSSEASTTLEVKKSSRIKTLNKSQAGMSKSTSKSFSKYFSKTLMDTSKTKTIKSEQTSSDGIPHTNDDLEVNHSRILKPTHSYQKGTKNPHFEMLYCNESETDMIKWNSKYKVKIFEVSASDEFSKKAEIMTKQISKDFYDWWLGLGNVEFKSEIKRPEDIEALFQVWFDEHASRGLVLHPKILPCVLPSIANYDGVPEASCPRVLKRQIAYDVHGETTPAHTMAFGTCLPEKMKHIPPKNNTKEMWDCVKIPEDLRSMACVWEDVNHLTSTKAFQKWLEARPHLPMPQCLKDTDVTGEKKQLFVVPSDYVVTSKSSTFSTQDLALPVSQFSLELKEVLSKLMNQ